MIAVGQTCPHGSFVIGCRSLPNCSRHVCPLVSDIVCFPHWARNLLRGLAGLILSFTGNMNIHRCSTATHTLLATMINKGLRLHQIHHFGGGILDKEYFIVSLKFHQATLDQLFLMDESQGQPWTTPSFYHNARYGLRIMLRLVSSHFKCGGAQGQFAVEWGYLSRRLK